MKATVQQTAVGEVARAGPHTLLAAVCKVGATLNSIDGSHPCRHGFNSLLSSLQKQVIQVCCLAVVDYNALDVLPCTVHCVDFASLGNDRRPSTTKANRPWLRFLLAPIGPNLV